MSKGLVVIGGGAAGMMAAVSAAERGAQVTLLEPNERLLCCENRRSHQCHPSYNTISSTVGLAVNTVMKHINKLAERQFITVEHTTYMDANGMKWNGNNLYTILPIQQAADAIYQRQLDRLDLASQQQRIANLLLEKESSA